MQCAICQAFCPLAFVRYNELVPAPQGSGSWRFLSPICRCGPIKCVHIDNVPDCSFAGGPRVTRRVCCFRHLGLFAKGPTQHHAMTHPAIEVQIALGYLKDVEDRVARLLEEAAQRAQTASSSLGSTESVSATDERPSSPSNKRANSSSGSTNDGAKRSQDGGLSRPAGTAEPRLYC